MGIPRLNRFIRQHCPCDLKKMHLSELKGKVLAIDTSIYLYKFKAKGSIITNMYLMCSLLKQYAIKPIFVFDGKPPPEKKSIIEMRKMKKEAAEKEYNSLKAKISLMTDWRSKKILEQKIARLAKKFIRIKNYEIREVKALFRSLGVSFMNAVGEADKWCAKLVLDGYAYACVSEDMDMFVYGCPLVIRYINLINQTAILYDLHKILENLRLSLVEFRSLCILSGSDYHYNSSTHIKPISYYYDRIKNYKTMNRTRGDFYNWLYDREALPLSKGDYCKAHALFNTTSLIILPHMIKKDYPQPNELKDILKKDNFIFPPDH